VKKIDREIQEIKEKGEKNRKEHEKRMAKIDSQIEEIREKRKKRAKEWEKERKNNDEVFLANVKRDCINFVKGHYRIWKISDQQANQLLGAD
jgi:hypothetical protein